MHGGHRYVPYHFKGLRPDQKEEIEAQRVQQLRDHKQAKREEQDEELLWAMQQEANRQLMLQNEIELADKERMLMEQHRAQHKVDKVEKDTRWQNFYGEKNAQPDPDA